MNRVDAYRMARRRTANAGFRVKLGCHVFPATGINADPEAGGTLENAVVFAPDGPMQTLRWDDEPVRHKVLDLLGDFALLGAWPQCEVVAIKSGHKLHCIMTEQLRDEVRAQLPPAQASS